MTARDLMSADPVTVTEDAKLADVVDIFQEMSIRHLPVVRGNELVGIISDRDMKSLTAPRLVDEQSLDDLRGRYDQPVSEVMNPDVLSVGEDAELKEIVELMLEGKVGAVPVVDKGTGDLVGIVSYIDVLRTLVD